ncbi:MAG TPA: hypothetical protein VGQ20_15390 [Acidimicrobiales bacterium]|nr:hypothetical protein [Acidimicrobiales bacterium]
MHSTSSPVARKGRNLARDARCAVAIGTDVLDLVVEGRMTKITDALQLQRVADAYASKYGWPVKVRDGAFFAEYGAPTAGPPPYEVYVIVPDVVFGFGPTRRSRRVQRAGDSDRTPTSTITARRVWFAAAGRGK